MRSFLISTACLLILIGTYIGFVTYTHTELDGLMNQIDTEITADVRSENWSDARSGFSRMSSDWHDHKHIFSFFLDTSAMLDTDFAIARAQGYLEAEEQASALAELYAISEQMKFLYQNELINLDNVF